VRNQGASHEHIYMALIHYPVYDRQKRVVAAALTTIDLHDLARLARTYGLGGVYVVTPLRSQQELARRLIEHWVTGWGSRYNPGRKEALSRVRLSDDLAEALDDVGRTRGSRAKTVATAARRYEGACSYPDMGRRLLVAEDAYVILFGTGWGLTEELVATCDYVLEPIEGKGYNHLSVRSAAGIIVDRLLGGRHS